MEENQPPVGLWLSKGRCGALPSCPPPKGMCVPCALPTSVLPPWETVFPFVIFPSHLSDWTHYLWTVIYRISELILCSAIVKHFCGPVPQGDIYFFSLLIFWLTSFSLSFLPFSSCYSVSSTVNWNIQLSSSRNKTSLENDKKSNAWILMRQLD